MASWGRMDLLYPRKDIAQLQQEPGRFYARFLTRTRNQRIYTLLLVLISLVALVLAFIEPSPKFVPVWIATSALYGALTYALY